jgi:hypothetical protein
MRLYCRQAAWAGLTLLSLCGCGRPRTPAPKPASVSLEVFVVSPAAGGETIRYVRRMTVLSNRTRDPDTVARELAGGTEKPAILHSTSWRWEKAGTIVLTYLAYCENAEFRGVEPVQLAWDSLMPPLATDPQHPRPAEIREEDVLSHGLRHLPVDSMPPATSRNVPLWEHVEGTTSGR